MTDCPPKKYFIGDSCLCWSFGDHIDSHLNDLVLYLFRMIRDKQQKGSIDCLDVVPSYNALAVYFDPVIHNIEQLEKQIDTLIDPVITGDLGETGPVAGEVHTFPTLYNGEDLPIVAEKCRMSEEEVIERHKKPHYKVAMIGFLPHFPYLIGLDPKLETPRLESPRTKIPKGSVAIGGAQTGIYSRESPGGWNIIGSTDAELLEKVNPGDFIIFKQVEE